jgi:hypothetical protein
MARKRGCSYGPRRKGRCPSRKQAAAAARKRANAPTKKMAHYTKRKRGTAYARTQYAPTMR